MELGTGAPGPQDLNSGSGYAEARIRVTDSRSQGRKGLEPKDIAAEIAKRWWPNVTINAVGPIAWRMYKKGLLRKRESKYFLPSNEVGAG